jgi:hypothetical protein
MAVSSIDGDTVLQLGAVVVGAFLATIGGYLASQAEHLVRRGERERTAALLFGDILSAMKLTCELAAQSQQRGDPYGPVTMRMLTAARREAESYERNRESLFDLRDAAVRARMHILMVRLTLTMEGALDAADKIAETELALAADGLSDGLRNVLEGRLAGHITNRRGSFIYGMEVAEEIEPLLVRLRAIAHAPFEEHERLLRADIQDLFIDPAGDASAAEL